MTIESRYRWEDAVAAVSSAYDADEARWARRQLREAFAATQPDARLSNKLVTAAYFFRQAEADKCNSGTIGATSRRESMEHLAEDISAFFSIISGRYKDGGSAVHPDLQPVMDKISHGENYNPSSIARMLQDLSPAAT